MNQQPTTKNVKRVTCNEMPASHATRYTLHATRAAGFSLIEMLVTVSIFAIISTVVIVRNAQFDNETLLQNLAFDIALSVRQAQQYGVNVRAAGDTFDKPYGIHFDAGSSEYISFLDGNGNGFYDDGADTDTLLQTYTIGRGATIGSICDISSGVCGAQETLDVVFRRPNPDAVINDGTITRAQVELLSARQAGRRMIIIEATGQISIQRPADEAEVSEEE